MGDRWRHVPYPPWWLDRARERRASLDRAVERVRQRVPLVAGAIGAIVFGSYATNRVGPTSDLDLIVLVEDDGLPWNERWACVARELDLDVPCDVLVYAPAEFERLKTTRNFIAQAIREGIWIDATAPR